jgi:hypothetical protein
MMDRAAIADQQTFSKLNLHLTYCKTGGIRNKKPLTELHARNHHLQAEPKTVFFT